MIARLQSPLVGIDANGSQGSRNRTAEHLSDLVQEEEPAKETEPVTETEPDVAGQTAVVLASTHVYTDTVMEKVVPHIKTHLFSDVKETIDIQFDFDADADAIRAITSRDADQVILLHEVWQPPIRGVLYYLSQVKSALPEEMPLHVLLTQDAGQQDLSVDAADLDFDVWKKAIVKLEDPAIRVERFL